MKHTTEYAITYDDDELDQKMMGLKDQILASSTPQIVSAR